MPTFDARPRFRYDPGVGFRHSSTGLLLLALLLGAGCGGDSQESAARAAAQPQGPSAARVSKRPLPPVQELYDAVQSKPDDFRVRHLLALALHREGRREEALEQFRKVAEQSSDVKYKIELGSAYASLQRMEDAEAAFLRALEDDPANAVVLLHLGNLAQRRGERAEAMSLYRQAIQNDPKYLLAHFQLGESLQLSGQAKDAYRSYEQVVSLDPTTLPEFNAFERALFHLASLDLQMGATERAVKFLRLLIEAVPNHSSAHLLLAQALIKLGREDEAREEQAIHQQLTMKTASGPPAP